MTNGCDDHKLNEYFYMNIYYNTKSIKQIELLF